jgi:hypothetical protein
VQKKINFIKKTNEVANIDYMKKGKTETILPFIFNTTS